jgi:hypothetical protein
VTGTEHGRDVAMRRDECSSRRYQFPESFSQRLACNWRGRWHRQGMARNPIRHPALPRPTRSHQRGEER